MSEHRFHFPESRREPPDILKAPCPFDGETRTFAANELDDRQRNTSAAAIRARPDNRDPFAVFVRRRHDRFPRSCSAPFAVAGRLPDTSEDIGPPGERQQKIDIRLSAPEKE
jgi:hypothetical protein